MKDDVVTGEEKVQDLVLRTRNYWLELISASGILQGIEMVDLQSETNELIAIFTSIVKKIKSKKNKLSSFSPHPSSFRGGTS